MADSVKGTATPKAEKRVNVPRNEFIKAMLTSKSAAEVAQKTGLKKGSVEARASQYRKKGVKLPTFQRGGAKLDIDDANAYIAQLQAPEDEGDEDGDEQSA